MPSKFSVRDKEIDAAGYGYEVNYDYRGANLTGYEFGPLFIAPAFVIAAQIALAKAVPPPASMPAR